MRTLIVDDELTNRLFLEYMLRPYGECVMAEDGQEAVEIFRENLEQGDPFDLVLLDIMMPNMDGLAALMEIRRMEKKSYSTSLDTKDYSFIVMQTSLSDPKHLTEAYIVGKCNGYITKPIAREELLEKLKRYKLIE